jgi:hypothetical protein
MAVADEVASPRTEGRRYADLDRRYRELLKRPPAEEAEVAALRQEWQALLKQHAKLQLSRALYGSRVRRPEPQAIGEWALRLGVQALPAVAKLMGDDSRPGVPAVLLSIIQAITSSGPLGFVPVSYSTRAVDVEAEVARVSTDGWATLNLHTSAGEFLELVVRSETMPRTAHTGMRFPLRLILDEDGGVAGWHVPEGALGRPGAETATVRTMPVTAEVVSVSESDVILDAVAATVGWCRVRVTRAALPSPPFRVMKHPTP